MQIGKERRRNEFIEKANLKGWPVTLRLRSLRDRVLEMQSDLEGLLIDEEELGASLAWEVFKKTVKNMDTFYNDSAAKFTMAGLARPG
jgi:hypothetical protein